MDSTKQIPRRTFLLKQSPVGQGTPCCYATRKSLRCARDATTTVRCCRSTSCLWTSRKTVAPSPSEAGRHSSRTAGFWGRRRITIIFRSFEIWLLLQKLGVSVPVTPLWGTAGWRPVITSLCKQDTDICILTEQTVGVLFYIYIYIYIYIRYVSSVIR